jgi:chromosome segregation ATPase
MMLADGEITPMRLRGKLVRFYLPDVFQELREKAKTSKTNCAKNVSARQLINGHIAVPQYLVTLSRIREEMQPILGWQGIKDANLLPPKLARRLRSYEAELDSIAPNMEELKKKLTLISDAHEAAESLPTDLAALKDARKKIESVHEQILNQQREISGNVVESKLAAGSAKDNQKISANLAEQCNKLVEQCEQA